MKSVVSTILNPSSEVRELLVGQKKRRQVGLLGGNFNPVHNGHLIIADQVFHQLGLDAVYLMPSAIPPHVDEKKTIASEKRLEMLELAVLEDAHIGIETIELTRGGKSYSYDTLKELREQHPDTDYFFIIGGDMVDYLPTWHRVDELVELVQLVGVRRPNYSVTSAYPLIWVDVPLMEISSSFIRKKVKEGCSVNYFLPRTVINYIEEKGLYQNDV